MPSGGDEKDSLHSHDDDDEATSVVQGFLEHTFVSDEFNDMKCRFTDDVEVRKKETLLRQFIYKDQNLFPSWICKSNLWASKTNQNLDEIVADVISIPLASRDALQNQNLAMWLMKNWAYSEKIGLQKSLQLINFFYSKVCEPQEYVFREGDIGDTFYIVVKGTLSIIKDGVGVVNCLTRGSSFGEIALTSNNSQRTASVQADDKVTLMVLSKQTYNNFIYSLQYAERMENMKLVKDSDFYTMHLSRMRSSEIVQNFGRKTFESGEHVFQDGDEIASVYFILEGEVRIEKNVNITTVNKWPVVDKTKRGGLRIKYNKHFMIKTLSKGDCFGAPDLQSVVISDYDVVANTRTTLVFCYVNEKKRLLTEEHLNTMESHTHTHTHTHTHETVLEPKIHKVVNDKELIDSIGNIIGGPSSFAKCGNVKRRMNPQKKFTFRIRSAYPDKLAFEDKAKVQVINERVYYEKKLYNRESRPNTVTLLCRPQRLEDLTTPRGNRGSTHDNNDHHANSNNNNNNNQQRKIPLSPLKFKSTNPSMSRPGTAGGRLTFSSPHEPLKADRPADMGTKSSNQTLQSECVIKLSPVKRDLHRNVSIDFSKVPGVVTPLLGFVTETVRYSNKGRRSPQKGIINLDTYSNNILRDSTKKL